MKRSALVCAAVLFATCLQVSTTSAPASASIEACTRVAVATTTVEGADGQGYVTILFVNEGARCELVGYPSVRFYSAHGAKFFGHDVHRSSTVFASPRPRPVVLTDGSAASVGVTWANDPLPRQTCTSAQWINVVLPGPRRANFQPSLHARPCGTEVFVTPFEAGPEPTSTRAS